MDPLRSREEANSQEAAIFRNTCLPPMARCRNPGGEAPDPGLFGCNCRTNSSGKRLQREPSTRATDPVQVGSKSRHDGASVVDSASPRRRGAKVADAGICQRFESYRPVTGTKHGRRLNLLL